MSTITSPSPVKESDRLREEIINSLSPVGSGPEHVNFPSKHGKGPDSEDGDAARPSCQRLSDSALPDPQGTDASATRPAAREPPIEGDPHKRFSWEDGPEQVTVGHEPDTDAESGVLPPSEQKDIGQSNPVIREPSLALGQSETIQMTIPPSNAGTMSHQVSQVSNMPRDGLNARALEPPSPVSVVTDRGAEEPSALSISGKESGPGTPPPAQKEPPSHENAPTMDADSVQPTAAKPAIMPPQATVKLMTFKEILAIPSAPERIKKYDETRVQFIKMDTGLASFLDRFKASTPELANMTSIFPAPAPRPNAHHMGTGAAAMANAVGSHGHPHLHSQPSAQQPYYQQYLQASSPTQTPVPGQAVPPPPVQHQHSDFKHPGNQLGHKSKELLSTAMKGGKGLLHKGRNKLRGTGDKTEEQQPASSHGAQHGPPPPSYLNKKADRRTSWGLLGGRTPLQKSSENTRGPTPPLQPNPSAPSPAPQLPEPSRISPFSSISQGGHSPVAQPGQGQAGPGLSNTPGFGPPPAVGQEVRSVGSGIQPGVQPAHGPQVSQHIPGPAASGSQTELVSPVSETHSTPGPGDAVRSQAPPANQPSQPQPSWEPSQAQPAANRVASSTQAARLPPGSEPTTEHHEADDGSDDWVVVPSESKEGLSDSHAPGQSEHPVDSAQDSEPPARHPSFVGLPPIRRTSTFGLSMGKKGRNLGEDSSPTIPEVPRLSEQPAEQPNQQAPKQQLNISSPETGTPGVNRIDSFPSMVAENGSIGPSTLPRPGDTNVPPVPTITRQEPTLPLHQTAMSSGQAVLGESEPGPHNQVSSEPAQRQAPINQGQFMPPVGRLQPGIIPPQIENGPVNSVRPPPGWRVEESHLSEPLLPTSRQRAASNAASIASDKSEPEDYGIDKETEAGLSRPKNRGAKTFPGQQQRQGSTSQAPPSPRPQLDHGNPLEGRGDIPCFRNSSQQTPDSQAGPRDQDQRPAAGPALAGDASRERRHSGFPGFGRGELASPVSPGGDNSLARSRESIIAHSSSTADQRAQETPSPQFPPPEKKRTIFSMNSFTSASHQKPPKVGLSRSSTSNSMSNETPSTKKRFSGLTNMFQKPGGGHGHTQRPPSSSQAGRASLQSQPTEFGAPQPPFASTRPVSRDRSNTTGSNFHLSGDGARQPTTDLRPAEPEDARGRRAVSAGTGFLSGLFNRSSSKPRDPKTPHGPGPMQMYAPPGGPAPHPQGPRMMFPQGQGVVDPRGPEPAHGRPQPQATSPSQPMMGRGSPQNQFQMHPSGPGQPLPAHAGPQPYFAGSQGVNQAVAAQPRMTPRAPQASAGHPEAQQPRPSVPPATSPSPLSQRSQAIGQPRPVDGVHVQPASQKAPSSFSGTTPASPKPDDTPGGLDKRDSSPLSRRSLEPPVGRSPLADPRTERFSQQSSQSSPSTQSVPPASTKSPQQQSSARFSAHGEGAQRPSPQPNDSRRISTPSLTQSSPAVGPQQAQTPIAQQQRLSVQAGEGGAASDPRGRQMPAGPSANGPGSQIPPSAIAPGQQQLPPGLPRSNTQTTQMSNPPGGMPRPQFLSQQQSFASTQSGASGHESHGKVPKLFGFKSKASGRGGNEGEKSEKKTSILSAFKKNYRQPEYAQQPAAAPQQQQQQFSPGKNGPQFAQQLPPGSMPGPQNQFYRPPGAPVPQMQPGGAGPPVAMNQRPMGDAPRYNSFQGMPNIPPGQPRPQQPPGQAHAMPQGPHVQQQQQLRMVPHPGQERQYELVPIPQAYRPVHGDGTPVASPYSMTGGYFLPQQGWVSQGTNRGQPNAPAANLNAPAPPDAMRQGVANQGQPPEQVTAQPSGRPGPPGSNTPRASASVTDGPPRQSPEGGKTSDDANRPPGSHLHLGTGPQVQRHPSDVSQLSSVAPLPHTHRSKPSDVSQMSAAPGRRGADSPVAQHSRNQSATSASSQKHPTSSLQAPVVESTVDATSPGQRNTPTAKTPTSPHPPAPMNQEHGSENVARDQTRRPTSVDPKQPAEFVMVSEPTVQTAGSPIAKHDAPSGSATQTPAVTPQEESATTQANGKGPFDTHSPRPDAVSNNDGKASAAPGPSKTSQPLAEEKQVAVNPKDQEEKILVEDDQNARHGDDEEQPMMSATSYPGQEWNPYSNIEDWD